MYGEILQEGLVVNMDINSFLSEVNNTGGVARPNRFTVVINITALVIGASQNSSTNWFKDFTGQDEIRFMMMCKEAELPGIRLNTTEIRTYGPEFKLPWIAQYQDMRMQFIVGADMKEKRFFDAWMWSIINPITNDTNYLKEYSTDIKITQQDESGYDRYQIKLVDAYPYDVSEMRLGYDDMDSYHLLPVQFVYRKYLREGMNMNIDTQYKGPGTQEKFNDTIMFDKNRTTKVMPE